MEQIDIVVDTMMVDVLHANMTYSFTMGIVSIQNAN